MESWKGERRGTRIPSLGILLQPVHAEWGCRPPVSCLRFPADMLDVPSMRLQLFVPSRIHGPRSTDLVESDG